MDNKHMQDMIEVYKIIHGKFDTNCSVTRNISITACHQNQCS